MNCPYCNNEMNEGKLCGDRHTCTYVYWKNTDENIKFFDGLRKKGSVNVNYKLGSYDISGYYCDVCKKMILDTSVNQ